MPPKCISHDAKVYFEGWELPFVGWCESRTRQEPPERTRGFVRELQCTFVGKFIILIWRMWNFPSWDSLTVTRHPQTRVGEDICTEVKRKETVILSKTQEVILRVSLAVHSNLVSFETETPHYICLSECFIHFLSPLVCSSPIIFLCVEWTKTSLPRSQWVVLCQRLSVQFLKVNEWTMSSCLPSQFLWVLLPFTAIFLLCVSVTEDSVIHQSSLSFVSLDLL
jgi:hypothetical protein